MSEDKRCVTCGNDEATCPTRSGCFTPKYKNWVAPGAKEENTGCPKCEHWKAVGIGAFCPDCGEKL